MPTKTVTSYTGGALSYKMNRTWERNGRGPRVPHAFSFTESYWVESKGAHNYSLSSGGAGTHPRSFRDSAAASNKLYAKMRDKAYTSLQLGADLGELHQTLSLIGGALGAVRRPLVTLGKLMKHIAKSKRGGVPLLGDSANAFLVFQYGVKPLMQTIYDSIDLLKNPFPKHRVRARITQSGSVPDGQRFVNTPTFMTESYTWKLDLSGSFDIAITNPNLFAVEQCGLLNLASVAWELTPLSFVFDWFLPIGRLFASWSDYAGCTRSNAYTTSFQRTMCTRARPYYGWLLVDESVACDRVLTSPDFSIKGIRLKTEQSVTHLTNALALIIGNTKMFR